MKKFLVLYRSAAASMAEIPFGTPEEREAEMAKWMAWGTGAGTALVDWGAPLGESATIKGGARSGVVEGFSIVQADTIEAAQRLFDGHPHLGFAGNTIQLCEMLPMPTG